MASITYLRLDGSNDTIWQGQSALTDLYAVTQAIQTWIQLYMGEWWENLNIGTPMFQSILGSPGSPKNQTVMQNILTQQIQKVPYVISVDTVTVAYSPITRAFSYKASVTTAFGPVTVTFVPPGQFASLG